MKKDDLILRLGLLGYPLIAPGKEKLSENQILEVLEELAGSGNLRLIEGFPVVLAYCAHHGLKLDFQNLLSKNKGERRKRKNLEKLLLISSYLLKQEEIEKPEGLDSITESFATKYGNLDSTEAVTLDEGYLLSLERLRNSLKRYTSSFSRSVSAREKEKAKQHQSFQLNIHLSTLFSPKQKELILKKLEGEPFTKTEQEYYSRVVKKKLDALADSEVTRIAKSLSKK